MTLFNRSKLLLVRIDNCGKLNLTLGLNLVNLRLALVRNVGIGVFDLCLLIFNSFLKFLCLLIHFLLLSAKFIELSISQFFQLFGLEHFHNATGHSKDVESFVDNFGMIFFHDINFLVQTIDNLSFFLRLLDVEISDLGCQDLFHEKWEMDCGFVNKSLEL